MSDKKPKNTTKPFHKLQKVVAISGCRDYNATTNKGLLVESLAKIYISSDSILFGGALGVDTDALVVCGLMNEDAEHKKELVAVCPDTLAQQPYKAQEAIKKYATSVIELKNKIIPQNGYESFKTRNRYLVDNSKMLVAFWDKESTGTKHAIDYAKEKNKPCLVVDLI